MPDPLNWKIVGLGSCGCRAADQIAVSCPWMGRAIYVSCDQEDLDVEGDGEKLFMDLSAYGENRYLKVREVGFANHERLREKLQGSELVVVVSGLGGKVGSGLAPVVAETSKELGCYTLGLFVMPFRSEKSKHFRAGSTLRILGKICDGIILVDNDELLDAEPRIPVSEAYRKINDAFVRALNEVARAEELGVGARKLVEAISGRRYAVLSAYERRDGEKIEEVVRGAVKKVWRTADGREAEKVLMGIRGITLSEMESVTEMLRVMLGGKDTEIEVGVGLKQGRLEAVLVVSGFMKTKFDDYDPISQILKGREIDPSYECALGLRLPGIASID